MNFRLRLFLDTIVDVVNQFDDIPLEGRRLVLESAMHIVEKAADNAIAKERMNLEEQNEQGLFEDKLGELSE